MSESHRSASSMVKDIDLRQRRVWLKPFKRHRGLWKMLVPSLGTAIKKWKTQGWKVLDQEHAWPWHSRFLPQLWNEERGHLGRHEVCHSREDDGRGMQTYALLLSSLMQMEPATNRKPSAFSPRGPFPLQRCYAFQRASEFLRHMSAVRREGAARWGTHGESCIPLKSLTC